MDLWDILPLLAGIALWLWQQWKKTQQPPETDEPALGARIGAEQIAAEVEATAQALSAAVAAGDERLRRAVVPELAAAQEELRALAQQQIVTPQGLSTLRAVQALLQDVSNVARARDAARHRDLRDLGDRLAEGIFGPIDEAVRRADLALNAHSPVVVTGNTAMGHAGPVVALPSSAWDHPNGLTAIVEHLGQRVASATIDEAAAHASHEGSGEPLTADSRALAHVLFVSWLYVTVVDAVGLQVLGPAYLRALAARLAMPEQPRATTRIQIGPEGVRPNPPPHARIHLAAEWLGLMGEETAARHELEAWDALHGHPQALDLFAGGMTLIPLQPLLRHFHDLMEGLARQSFSALGKQPLTALPGLSDWSVEAHDALAAMHAFLRGQTAGGSARALLAGAVDGALAHGEHGVSISEALLASMRPARRGRAAGPRRIDRRAERRAVRPRDRRQRARRWAEALVLGEVLLERPGSTYAPPRRAPKNSC